MTHTTEKISFIPHRGPIEPITEVRKSEINLTDNFLELIYDFSVLVSGIEETRTAALLINKKDLSLGLTTWYNEDDKDKNLQPRVELFICGGYQDYIYVETLDEAYEIYKKLKNWLLK